ncbi:H-type lectin domain-containing protein [Wenxinia marina]|uniref:Wenxma_17, whole genome shotgun sequence n=1 Tax=Wenxinia marina DSM 24838 TaxID=1123501 RepID=A0A0D0Q6E6_9RHOB|nr:H-type lectin domain-containing protein [Wenxinia marina]KIQ68032.1 H-type lectin domain protein [Wenxinia marina DSM 24838]GGL75259.1 hypothetical protein GCM10011392_32380 [Wenxinia marina]
MKKLHRGALGVAQGDTLLFSDFADDGEMWAGEGERTVRRAVRFDETFLDPPVVQAWLTMWDISNAANARLDVRTTEVTGEGFTIEFRTWGDSRIARVRVGWLAIGAVRDDDHWDID